MQEKRYPPVFREIPYESPFAVYSRLRSRNSILLESVKGPEQIARYSFIGIEPYLVFKTKDRTVEIDIAGKKTVSYRNPLERLRELVNAYSQRPVEGLPPFQGGAAGMLSYDFVQYLERLPGKAEDDLNIPDAHFLLIDRLVAFDHAKKKCWIIVCPGARETVAGYSDIADAMHKHIDEAEDAVDRIYQRIRDEKKAADKEKKAAKGIDIIYEMERRNYMNMVERAKEYIASGDIFQANLSLRLSADIADKDPWQLYTILRSINPSPFAAYLDFGDYQIVSSSPERLIRVKERVVDTRPIAGTRPRGKDTDEDEMMRTELLLNEKERAEHIMLIDLERNDLGRVSDYGSVIVDELMTTEDYSHVIHIVSNVKGALARGKDCFSVIRAVFPGGTITGVPKVRCMEIIDELEPKRRGPYTGSIGYIGFNKNMDLNIVIRTFLVKDKRAYVQAGSGIVADSVPEREYYESMKKAEALIRTLEYL
ncbi:MAG: anthranilate synthase component I family protein [Nitrospirota bacterium]